MARSIMVIAPDFTEEEVWKLEFVTEDGHTQTHFLCFENVRKFIEATMELQYYPGINPYNKRKTPRLKEILVWRLHSTGPFWWSTPGLGKNDDGRYLAPSPGGAVMLEWSLFRQISPSKLTTTKDWLDSSFSIPSVTKATA